MHTSPKAIVVKDNLLCLLKDPDELDVVVSLDKWSDAVVVQKASQKWQICSGDDVGSLDQASQASMDALLSTMLHMTDKTSGGKTYCEKRSRVDNCLHLNAASDQSHKVHGIDWICAPNLQWKRRSYR